MSTIVQAQIDHGQKSRRRRDQQNGRQAEAERRRHDRQHQQHRVMVVLRTAQVGHQHAEQQFHRHRDARVEEDCARSERRAPGLQGEQLDGLQQEERGAGDQHGTVGRPEHPAEAEVHEHERRQHRQVEPDQGGLLPAEEVGIDRLGQRRRR
jgi:hypothetical protein